MNINLKIIDVCVVINYISAAALYFTFLGEQEFYFHVNSFFVVFLARKIIIYIFTKLFRHGIKEEIAVFIYILDGAAVGAMLSMYKILSI